MYISAGNLQPLFGFAHNFSYRRFSMAILLRGLQRLSALELIEFQIPPLTMRMNAGSLFKLVGSLNIGNRVSLKN